MKQQEIQNLIKANECTIDLLGYGVGCYELQVNDTSFPFLDESERPYYDISISNEHLFSFLKDKGLCEGLYDYLDAGGNHCQEEVYIEPSEIEITEDIIKEYLLNNNKFKVN